MVPQPSLKKGTSYETLPNQAADRMRQLYSSEGLSKTTLVSQTILKAVSSSSQPTSSAAQPAVGTIVNRPQGAWVVTFERNLYNGYKVTPKYYKYYGNGLWEVWVKEINTQDYPYVTVDQYTGNFHG
ncbi:hypothetical protein [Oenococcus kitaharae]|uniref:hypothetical protein n=1 Tax=Oenococcus kitaharae TaxID=336988 RepID=UPI001F517922|nr:hypothetical protein [Oenococcus kitaharae]